ncbi:MAG TPA: alanine racemase C-terminal domain-containing protein, partial [Mycobacteriales bacterium]|nr:alanine racemase C-terminal domain-containing protein [Mycobacteriales bacterium]
DLAGTGTSSAGDVRPGTGTSSAGDVRPGDYATLFGPGDNDEPTADDWAEVAGTISYELLVRVGSRVRRIYLNDLDTSAGTGPRREGSIA